MKQQKYMHTTLRKKILFSNAIVTALLCTIGFVAFSGYYFLQQNQQFQYAAQTNAQTKASLFAQNISIAENTATQIRLNSGIIDIFSELQETGVDGNLFTQQPSLLQYIYENTIPYLIKQNYISRIVLFNDQGDLVLTGSTNTYVNDPNYISEEKLALLENADPQQTVQYQFYPTQPDEGLISGSGYLCIIQSIVDYSLPGAPVLGYVEVQIDFSTIVANMGELIDEQAITLSYQEQELFTVGQVREYMVQSKTLEPYLAFTLEITQYNIVGLRLTVTTILLLLCICVFVFFNFYYFQRRNIRTLTAPLIELCHTMPYSSIAQIETDEMLEFDEIKNLNASFVTMVQQLQQSIDQLVLERTSKLNAQMLALQAHINPHFIHNTLAIISSLTDDGETEKARLATNKLSAIIRYSADYTNRTEWLSKELTHINDYLEIIALKYEEDFSFSIVPVDGMQQMEFQVPKFILQPLVENALAHSLKHAKFPWHIGVRYHCNESGWHVEIADNGVGIHPDKVTDIKAKFAQISDANVEALLSELQIGGYSLTNILIQMQLHYQQDMIFEIAENEQGGTTVIIGARTTKEHS